MADKDQLRILKQGPAAWNAWRSQAGDTRIDLRGVDLRVGVFNEADRSLADLLPGWTSTRQISVISAWKPSSAGWTRQISPGPTSAGPTSAGQTSARQNSVRQDLTAANLSWADLSGAGLREVNLREVFSWGPPCRTST